jgi:hypothetical protein
MNNDRRKFIAFASALATASLVFPTGVFAQVLMSDVDILGCECVYSALPTAHTSNGR